MYIMKIVNARGEGVAKDIDTENNLRVAIMRNVIKMVDDYRKGVPALSNDDMRMLYSLVACYRHKRPYQDMLYCWNNTNMAICQNIVVTTKVVEDTMTAVEMFKFLDSVGIVW